MKNITGRSSRNMKKNGFFVKKSDQIMKKTRNRKPKLSTISHRNSCAASEPALHRKNPISDMSNKLLRGKCAAFRAQFFQNRKRQMGRSCDRAGEARARNFASERLHERLGRSVKRGVRKKTPFLGGSRRFMLRRKCESGDAARAVASECRRPDAIRGEACAKNAVSGRLSASNIRKERRFSRKKIGLRLRFARNGSATESGAV